MEHFEQLTVDSAQDKPSLWLRYVNDTFVIWPYGAEGMQNFLTHLKNLRQAIQFISCFLRTGRLRYPGTCKGNAAIVPSALNSVRGYFMGYDFGPMTKL
jgi:hypothetical protein